jgi:hypothetical protein
MAAEIAQIRLPIMPPARLAREAVASYNRLNPGAPISIESAPWPELVNVVHAFVRHSLTSFDLELDAHGYDEDYRNKLAGQIRQAACRAYAFL